MVGITSIRNHTLDRLFNLLGMGLQKPFFWGGGVSTFELRYGNGIIHSQIQSMVGITLIRNHTLDSLFQPARYGFTETSLMPGLDKLRPLGVNSTHFSSKPNIRYGKQ